MRTYPKLNINYDPELNQDHYLPDYTVVFAKELEQGWRILATIKDDLQLKHIVDFTIYFTIDMLIEYHDNYKNRLPIAVINEVKRQVLIASKEKQSLFEKEDVSNYMFTKLDKKIKEDAIVYETHDFMNKVRAWQDPF